MLLNDITLPADWPEQQYNITGDLRAMETNTLNRPAINNSRLWVGSGETTYELLVLFRMPIIAPSQSGIDGCFQLPDSVRAHILAQGAKIGTPSRRGRIVHDPNFVCLLELTVT